MLLISECLDLQTRFDLCDCWIWNSCTSRAGTQCVSSLVCGFLSLSESFCGSLCGWDFWFLERWRILGVWIDVLPDTQTRCVGLDKLYPWLPICWGVEDYGELDLRHCST